MGFKYGLDRYVLTDTVWFLRVSTLKIGIILAHSGIVLHVPKLHQQNPIEKESLLPECSSSLIVLRSNHSKFFKQYFLMLFFFQHLTK